VPAVSDSRRVPDPGPPSTPAPAKSPGRAGRDLPAAIAVGVSLGALIIVTLFTVRIVWILILAGGVTIGAYELVRALNVRGLRPPLLPVLGSTMAIPLTAYAAGSEGQVMALFASVAVIVAWRAALQPAVGMWSDVAAGVFVAVYVGFLAGYASLLTSPSDGPRRVLIFIAATVCSDVGGYATGVLFGKHPMAPTVSPKKSWEGFAGSAAACMLFGALTLHYLLHQPFWEGLVFGMAVVCTATLGDLGESMIKRDIGIKDMGSLLPGHGGVMDRLDSLLCTAPVAWLLLRAFAPT
jgi:phosphatidate cytidylyltransferase